MKKSCGAMPSKKKAMHKEMKTHLKKDIARDAMDIKEDKSLLKKVKKK